MATQNQDVAEYIRCKMNLLVSFVSEATAPWDNTVMIGQVPRKRMTMLCWFGRVLVRMAF